MLQVLASTKELEMWGDGKQTRSFTFVDDCVEGILRITKSDCREPLNLGSTEMVRRGSADRKTGATNTCVCVPLCMCVRSTVRNTCVRGNGTVKLPCSCRCP